MRRSTPRGLSPNGGKAAGNGRAWNWGNRVLTAWKDHGGAIASLAHRMPRKLQSAPLSSFWALMWRGKGGAGGRGRKRPTIHGRTRRTGRERGGCVYSGRENSLCVNRHYAWGRAARGGGGYAPTTPDRLGNAGAAAGKCSAYPLPFNCSSSDAIRSFNCSTVSGKLSTSARLRASCAARSSARREISPATWLRASSNDSR